MAKQYWRWLVGFAVACSISCSMPAKSVAAEKATRPNLVLIVADDHGYADVGFNGSKEIPTPHIDRIASEGIRFTDAYVSFPVCGPSRAGLLTGRYQDRFGFLLNPTLDPSNPDAGIPLEERTIAEALTSVGYRSMAVGKWHVGTHPSLRPLNRGFEHFFGFLSGGHQYFPEELVVPSIESVKEKGDWYRTKILADETPVEIDEYLTDELSHAAADFVRQDDGRPFFLYLAYNAPHTPMQATQEYLDRFPHIKDPRRKTYAAMVSAMDDGVGEVLVALDESGQDENTLVVFISDNGGATTNASQNDPLRGHKGEYFEGGIRVPFAVRWPARIDAGSVCDSPVTSLDLYATMVEVNGIPVPNERPLDGDSLLTIFDHPDAEPLERDLYWRLFAKPAYVVRRGAYKAIVDRDARMLFDLGKDRDESDDLASKQAEAAQELADVAQAWGADFATRPAFPGRLSWPPAKDRSVGNHRD